MERHLVEAALKDVASLKLKLEAILEAIEEDIEEEDDEKKARASAKSTNGRLSEAGIRRLRSMIDGGCRDSEIARALKITQPAVIHQRQKYAAEKR